MYGFRGAHNTISLIIRDVCEAIIEEFAEEVIACPTTPKEWKSIADEFGTRWQFFHALGALDGKHIAIGCPKNGGSIYYNYKGFHSIVLLALVDADYKFIWVEVGANGSASDAHIFQTSDLREAIKDGTIGFPADGPLPGDDRPMPYFVIGDDAFPLREWLMKPFSKRNITNEERIFNYRLARGRRIVDYAFGILGNRFQCLLTTLRQTPNTVESIGFACICLHNLMRISYPGLQNTVLDQEDSQRHVVLGAWWNGLNMQDVDKVAGGNRTTKAAKSQREYLKHYYNSPVGAVSWQNNMI